MPVLNLVLEILDDFLKDWAAVQKKLYAGEITQAEYFEWKIMWPE